MTDNPNPLPEVNANGELSAEEIRRRLHLYAAPNPQEPCPEDCTRCSGEYCEQHFTDPCECDVVERHTPQQPNPQATEQAREFISNHYRYAGGYIRLSDDKPITLPG